MATDLPEKPLSREEAYLADIAGQEVVLPEKPESRKEQYLAYIAENGGGGGGGTNNFNQLTNRPSYNNTTMTGSTSIPKVPTKTSELSNDSNFVTSGSLATVATTGAYSDLSGTPTIPVVNNATLTVTQNGTSMGTFTANSSTDTTIAVTDTTYSNFTGTDGTSAGTNGLVPAPATTDAGKFLKADGTWATAGGGGGGAIVELTTADYNWPTDNPTSVALWLLPEGIYRLPSSGVSAYVSSSVIWTSSYGDIIEVAKTQAGLPKAVLYFYGNTAGYAYAVTSISTGSESVAYTRMLNMNDLAQTTGDSTISVMSQNATTGLVYADPSTKQTIKLTNGSAANRSVAIGHDSYTGSGSAGEFSVAIGYQANTYGTQGSVAIGQASRNRGKYSVVIGYNSGTHGDSNHKEGQIMLGAYSGATRQGEMNIGSSNTTCGFNSSNYRLISGVYDGQSAHDAATVAQGNTLATSAPTTATVGVLGQLYTDTTNMHTYQCTAIDDTTDPSNPSYTWTQRW